MMYFVQNNPDYATVKAIPKEIREAFIRLIQDVISEESKRQMDALVCVGPGVSHAAETAMYQGSVRAHNNIIDLLPEINKELEK